ncbi:hypothetical protein DFQ28_010163 [Apophysomyces sp. BC1034]|nr:hypothetical protein DFQ28_010163 [Apophysomyces sp. BC1034]
MSHIDHSLNSPQALSPAEDNFEKQFWQEQMDEICLNTPNFKLHHLPLARIKKVMKSDEDVKPTLSHGRKMISTEAPLLFSKSCDILITEITLRAWKHAVKNKRRTLQRSDIAAAVSNSEMFDFLIDIVPREEHTRDAKAEKPAFDHRPDIHSQYTPFGYTLPSGQEELVCGKKYLY